MALRVLLKLRSRKNEIKTREINELSREFTPGFSGTNVMSLILN
jgi:hypothetical protein